MLVVACFSWYALHCSLLTIGGGKDPVFIDPYATKRGVGMCYGMVSWTAISELQ